MGSPVSVVVAKIVIQSIDERALATYYQRTLPFSFRYVDDTITALQQDHIEIFHNHNNEQNWDLQFTKGNEENGTIYFQVYLVSHDSNKLRTTVYRKPTHTDRLLDQSSYNRTSHKATTIKTLTRLAQLICDSANALLNDNDYQQHVLHKNNYKFASCNRRHYIRTLTGNHNFRSI